MNFQKSLAQLMTEKQQHHPESLALIDLIKKLTATWNVTSQTIKFSGYQLQNSLWILILIVLLTTLSGFRVPLISLCGAIFLGVALLRELSHPLLGKTSISAGQNLLLNLPAKNKEIQKVFLVASYDQEAFLKTPFAFKPGLYLTVLLGIITAMITVSVFYFLTAGVVFNWLNLCLVIVIALLNLNSNKTPLQPASLKNCAALLETAVILTKVKPDITSVTLCFCGSRSLNSAILALKSEFAKSPKELTYVVNLIEADDINGVTLQCLTEEGALPVKKASSALLDLLLEVAREKSLSICMAKTDNYTETYPLDRAKLQPISIVIPQNENVPLRDVRELLCGLIRKLDH